MVTLTNCTMADNREAPYVSNARGLGFYATGTDVDVINCTFTSNGPALGSGSRAASGGGIRFENGTLSVAGSSFVANGHHNQGGAALFLGNAAQTTMRHCLFRDNTRGAGNIGGTVYINVGNASTVTVQPPSGSP